MEWVSRTLLVLNESLQRVHCSLKPFRLSCAESWGAGPCGTSKVRHRGQTWNILWHVVQGGSLNPGEGLPQVEELVSIMGLIHKRG